MVDVALIVEGGGDPKNRRPYQLQEWRRGFSALFGKTILGNRSRPRVEIAGGRSSAIEQYKHELAAPRAGRIVLLLVDSEDPVNSVFANGHVAVAHLRARPADAGILPATMPPTTVHLMVQEMETWYLADPDTLEKYFGQVFNAGALPAANTPLEGISKARVNSHLQDASRGSRTKEPYDKGKHSAELLSKLDPVRVQAKCQWARRLIHVINELKQDRSVTEMPTTVYGWDPATRSVTKTP